MRSRPLAATLRRLDKVESMLFDDTGKRRGGVMRVPPVLPAAEWEALAMASQAALARAAREDIDRHELSKPHAEPLPPALDALIEGVHFHRIATRHRCPSARRCLQPHR